EHELLSAPGTIHVPVADYDGDGDLDIATIVSQDEEELWGFENLGAGRFTAKRLWFTMNFDIGSAGLVADDLDQDGDPDLLLPVGDNLEIAHCYPQPYHGCLWFENTGGWNFKPRRISDFGATYAAAAGDIDGDGDRDVALVSMINNWDNPECASVIWLENDGNQQFTPWQIDSRPTHRVTVAVGDLDGDGRPDIVSGGLHLTGPFDRIGGVTAWINQGRKEGR
ncbi:MAG: VCBS repeat-containing protein, partial [Planctomycetaceae bacterium]